MKFYLSIFILTVLLSSCGERKLSDVITGEWKVEKMELPDMEIAPSIIESVREEMLSTTYSFQEAEKFTITSGLIPKGANGKWKLNEEKGEMYIEYSANNTEFKSTYKIEMVDETHIIFRQKLGADLGEMKVSLIKK